MARRSFFTTFEISQICGVNPTTVQNWVKGRKLKAFQTPGKHRRIRREDLIAFMEQFGIPIPEELVQNHPLIMIVDDEIEIVDMLETLMKSGDRDVNVVKAHSGVEALLMIGERKPDLLILDLMMAEMNGFEVCQRLKSNAATRSIKIAAITGDHSAAVEERARRAGADLFFTKPLDVTGFRQQCFKLLRL